MHSEAKTTKIEGKNDETRQNHALKNREKLINIHVFCKQLHILK
jgi:hypothetical protein